MRSFNSLCALLLTAGALSAQTVSADPGVIPAPSNLTTVTRAGVFANREVSSLGAGVSVLRPTALDAASPGAAAALRIVPGLWPVITSDGVVHPPRVMGATWGWSGRAGAVSATDLTNTDGPILLATAGATGTGNPMQSPQTWCLTLNGGPGHLLIEFKGRRVNRSFAAATVGLRDRALRFEATHDGHSERVLVPLPGGAAGLPVKVSLEGFAHGAFTGSSAGDPGVVLPGSFEAGLSVQFRPDDRPHFCTIAPDQRGCPAGGALHGAIINPLDPIISPVNPHIALSLEGALSNAIGVTLLNRSGELVPALPLTVCPILVNPVVVGLFETDDHGNARTFLRAPPIPIPGRFGFFIQQATVKFGGDAGFRIASSNTLAVKCWHPAIAITDEIR